MCLENVTIKRPKTATEDIPCFKVLRKRGRLFQTPYMYEYIKLGKSYISILDKPDWIDKVARGIHAFLTLEQALDAVSIDEEYVIIKCIILKGAKYYIGVFTWRFGNTAIAATEIVYGTRTLKLK